MNQETFNPNENETANLPIESFVRSIAKEEVEIALKSQSNKRTFKNTETGKTIQVIEVCRRCNENVPLNTNRYCDDCQQHLDYRDKLFEQMNVRKSKK